MAKKTIDTNKNAHIITRVDRKGKVRTETSRRDKGRLDIAVSTDPRTGVTQVFFDRSGRNEGYRHGPDLRLTGREARTLFITLQRHYASQGAPALSPAFWDAYEHN